jgi:hypothetical protein
MVGNFLIVLFKNKKKRKIIKRYSTEVNVKKKFKKILNENSIIMDVKSIFNHKRIKNKFDYWSL